MFPFKNKTKKAYKYKNTSLSHKEYGSGVVTHACHPTTLGGGGGQIAWGQELEPSLANMVKLHLY